MKFTSDFDPDNIKNKLKIIKIEPDISYLTDSQKNILSKLIECSKIINDIFYIQKYSTNLELKKEIEQTQNEKIINYYKIMQGPFDQFNDYKPYIEGIVKSDKCSFYPEDLTKEEWEKYLKYFPEKKDEFISPYSIIIRQDKELKSIKYSDCYKEYLQKASNLLIEASEIAGNPTIKSYLLSVSNAFLTNDFFESDIRWLQLEDNDIESIIGAHEFYEDKFLGYKASFTSFIAVKNREEFKKLSLIQKVLDTLQDNLPIPEYYKNKKRGTISQIQIVNLIYSAGDAKGPIQTVAFNLPNSHKIRSMFGSKKVLIYNIMEAKFNTIINLISHRILDENTQLKVTFPSYFNFILLHEISHELGVGCLKDNEGNLCEVSYFLKDMYTIIEEAKADVMGVFSLIYFVKECYITDCTFVEIATTYLIGLFHSMRFGKENAHGVANIIQWNFLRKEEIIIKSKENLSLSIDFHKFESEIKNLLSLLLTFQGEGDYEKSKKFVEEYSIIDEELAEYIKIMDDLPIDIYPWFPIAGEKEPVI